MRILSKYNSHTKPLFLNLIFNILILHELKFYFKYMHNNYLPTY